MPTYLTRTIPLALILFGCQCVATAAITSITLSFTGDGSGNSSGFSLSGSGAAAGAIAPLGASSVSITGGGSARALNVSFTFQFTNEDTLTASSVATVAPDLISGTANITGGTGALAMATGSFSFSISAPFSTTAADVMFTLTGSGQVTTPSVSLSDLQANPGQVSFSALAQGDSPAPQQIAVSTAGQMPLNFAAQIEGSAAGLPAPNWLTISPSSGATPGTLVVSVNQTGLAAGSYTATIHLSVPGNTAETPVDVSVSLTVSGTSASPQLGVAPSFLRFAAGVQSPSTFEQDLAVSNTGGGTLTFNVSTSGASSWIAVTPGTGQAAPNAPATVRVQVNTQGLAVGSFYDVIHVASSAASVDVPVSLVVSDQGPVIALDVVGQRFEARQGNGLTTTKIVKVLNLGDPSSTFNWTADLLSGSDWLTLGEPGGSSTPAQPGILPLTPNASAASFPVGGRYALVRVSAPQALNSPQYFVAVLDVEAATNPPAPDPIPAGLFFSTAAGVPPSQTISVYSSTAVPVSILASAATADGANWLTVSLTRPSTSTQTPGLLAVSINAATLLPGIYHGTINIALGAVLRTVDVTLVVVSTSPVKTQLALTPAQPQVTAGCTPTRLAVTQSGLAGNFSVPAGWPATLVVQLNDDCGNPVTNGAAVASFSNGDPPLSLIGDQHTGSYSATWQPGVVSPQMTISVRATAPALQTATAQWIGAIGANAANPPTLVPNGALHIFFSAVTAAHLGGGLAPGNVAQVYGTGLASAPASPDGAPLPPQLNGTFMLVGGFQAPLFYASDQLLDVQIPFELTPNRQYPAIVSVNNALTLPETIDLVPAQPGIAARADSTAIAQHVSDSSLVTAANPATPRENVVIYLAGMGATNPSVKSGDPTPLALVPVTASTTLTIDGQDVHIDYAGLTPTGVGLYQINFAVPPNARSGNLPLIVTQDGHVISNATTLPVKNN